MIIGRLLLWLTLGYMPWGMAMDKDDFKQKSMLYQASEKLSVMSGQRSLWANRFMQPAVNGILKDNSVWFDAYAEAIMKDKEESVLGFLARPKLWALFSELGISVIHTGPLKQAGGVDDKGLTPSIDGGFDPISLDVDKRYGGNKDYLSLSQQATLNHGLIIDDLVPGHTGKGYDFYLALKNIPPFVGLYSLIEIPKEHWPLLPKVNSIWQSENLSVKEVDKLTDLDILPGHLKRVMFTLPHKKSTGWDVTAEVTGDDGIKRRWAYLHYFKPGQPSLNWLDPSFSAHQLMSLNILHSLKHLGARMMRIDANPFLGAERDKLTGVMNSEATSLALITSNQIAQLVRKLGGRSFQELNLTLADTKRFMHDGADFSYDFITRPGIQHALLTGDARLLETMINLMIDNGIDSRRLIHGMQNHDELTYELVEFAENETRFFQFGDKQMTGADIRQLVLEQMGHHAKKRSYLHLAGNGLCTSSASLVASRLALSSFDKLTPQEQDKIKQGMLLMAAFNAFIPGVVNVSGWDLVGSLPLDESDIKDRLSDGDCRWFNRGAYSLLKLKDAKANLVKAPHLFSDLETQLNDKHSFVSALKKLLHIRKEYALNNNILKGFHRLSEDISLMQTTNDKASYLVIFNFSPDKKALPASLDLTKLKLLYESEPKAQSLAELSGFGFKLLQKKDP